MIPRFDLNTGQWKFPLKASSNTLKFSNPRRLVLSKSFGCEEPINSAPEESIKSLKESLHASDDEYFPPAVLHEFILEDAMQRTLIFERDVHRNKLQILSFGDSVLAAYPFGEDGRRLCLARLLPWFDHLDDDYCCFQSLPNDYAQWDCKGSIRDIWKVQNNLLVMTDRQVFRFDVDPEYLEPSFVGSFLINSSSVILDYIFADDCLVILTSDGRIWLQSQSGEIVRIFVEESGYRWLSSHPSKEKGFFLAATNQTVTLFSESFECVDVFKSEDGSIVGLWPITSESNSKFIVSTEGSLSVVDLGRIGTIELFWSNDNVFSGACIKHFYEFLLSDQMYILLSTTEKNNSDSYILKFEKDGTTWLNPRIVPSYSFDGELSLIGSSTLVVNDEDLYCFQLFSDGSVSYTFSTTNHDRSMIPMPRHEKVSSFSNYDVESSIKSKPFAHTLLPKDLSYLDYGFVWDWLWFEKADAPSETRPIPEQYQIYGLGAEATNEIIRLLEKVVIDDDPFDGATEVEWEGAAAILESRWSCS